VRDKFFDVGADGLERFWNEGLFGEARESVGFQNKNTSFGVDDKIGAGIVAQAERSVGSRCHLLYGRRFIL